jgi:nitroreductase
MKKMLALAAAVFCVGAVAGEGIPAGEKTVKLPAPQKTGGASLREALAQRQSARDYSAKEFSAQQVADLLWAASGVNRDDGRMTAPTASNKQELILYIALPQGVYAYAPKENNLTQVAAEDLRAATGGQPFVGKAAAEVILVADYAKMGGSAADKEHFAWIDAGYISQNLYLFAAAEGLNSVARAMVPRENLAPKLNLQANQIIIVQTIGFRP